MTDHDPIFWVAQGLTIASFIIVLGSGFLKDRKAKLRVVGSSSLLLCFASVLLGSWTVAGVAAVNATRGFSMAVANTIRSRLILVSVFVAAQVTLFVFVTGSFETWVAFLPLIAVCASTIAFAFEKRSRRRVFKAFAGLLWGTYLVSTGVFWRLMLDTIAWSEAVFG